MAEEQEKQKKQQVFIFDPTTYQYLTVVDMTDVPSNGTLIPPIAMVNGKEIILDDAVWHPDTNSWTGSNQELVAASSSNLLQNQSASIADDVIALKNNFVDLQNSVALLTSLLLGDSTDPQEGE